MVVVKREAGAAESPCGFYRLRASQDHLVTGIGVILLAGQPVLCDARRLTEFKRRRKRDVAQVVERLLWEQDVAGSSPVIPIYRMGMYGKPLCLLTMWDFPDG